MRRSVVRAVIATAAVASLSLAACAEDGAGTSTEASPGGSEPAAAACGSEVSIEEITNVGLAYDVGGRGDLSFNDAIARGLDASVAELDFEAQELSPSDGGADRADLLRQLADSGANPIIGAGFIYAEDMDTVAAEYPDVQFIRIDGGPSECLNVSVLTFDEPEGSYLVGAAAALKSETGTVGFVGANESVLINGFGAGYLQGAESVNPDIEVLDTRLGTGDSGDFFDDPASARVAAEAMYEQGADIVYHAAGGSGTGVFEAAAATGNLAIGVDSDQYEQVGPELQGVIITSMLKNLETAVPAAMNEIVETGTVESRALGLADDGVGYSTSGGAIDDIVDQLEEIKQQIIDGEITVD